MNSERNDNRLLHLYLTGVRPTGNEIGVGAYGRVFEVEYCGTVFAAKEVHQILAQGVSREEYEGTRRAFLNECAQSISLGHPNVVQFLGVYNPGGESRLPVLVMERMQESLTSLVKKNPNIPMCVKLSMLVDVSRGLWYLHSHNPSIVHRDLSPNNVLLTSQFVAKISDLGVAKVIRADREKTKTRAPGTVDFMGPEALAEIPEYGPSLDVFSYGGLILHVVNQEWPKPLHYVVTDPKTRKLVALSEVKRRQEHVEKMRGAPVDLKHLVEQCLDNDPSRRPPISDVSERMRRMKEAEKVKCPDVTMNPTTITITTTTNNSQPINTQANMFEKIVSTKWKERALLPVGRSAHTAVSLHGSVYVGGGYDGRKTSDGKECYRLDIYNIYVNQWSAFPITTPQCFFAMTVLDDKLIIVGGEITIGKATNKILVLDDGRWKDYGKISTARSDAVAVGYQSMLIVSGGLANVKGIWTTLATTELLDTTNGCWYTCDDLPVAHRQLKAVIVHHTLYLLGGVTVDDDQRPSSKLFTASLDNLGSHQLKWQALQDTPWFLSTPVVLYNKFLLTVGGRQQSDVTSQTREVCAFNPSTGVWKQIASIPAARSLPAVVGVADNRMLVVGGLTNQKKFSTNTWIITFESELI